MRTIITPDEAKFMLQRNLKNRPLKEKHIAGLALTMKRGEFLYNGETIILSKTGTILDGQHRLMACAMSGVPIEVEIISDIDEIVMPTIDTGIKRTGSDVLSLNGIKNSARISRIVKNIIMFRSRRGFVSLMSERHLAITNSNILDFCMNEPEIIDSIHDARTNSDRVHKVNFIELTLLTTCWYIFKDINRDKADYFVNSLISGTSNDVVFLLRERLITDAMSPRKMPTNERVKYIFKAWNKFLRGDNVKKLIVHADEQFEYPNNYLFYGKTYIKGIN